MRTERRLLSCFTKKTADFYVNFRKNAAQDVVLKRILAYMEGHEAFCREKEHPEWMLSIPRK